jgi:hypothetical protein
LPVILSTADQDMPEGLAYVKYVPAGEGPVNINDVVSFATQVYQIPGVNTRIREYADEHVSWKGKIKTVLNYLANKNDAVAKSGQQTAAGS